MSVWGWRGTCRLQHLIGLRYWRSLPAVTSSSDWLEKPIQVWERPRIMSQFGGPKECSVPPGQWSLTSWSSLYSNRLCFRDALKMWDGQHRRVWGQRGTCRFQGLMDWMGVLRQPTGRNFTCQLATETALPQFLILLFHMYHVLKAL